MWASMTEATTDLRTLLSDGSNDKIVFRKKCFGTVDGVNLEYKTFETRRSTNFTTSVAHFGVYLGGVRQTPGIQINFDDPTSGQFTFATAPTDTGVSVEATYYYQWFLDPELQQFITSGLRWLNVGTDPTQLPDGLIPAALHYAGQESYHKLAVRWSVRMSEMYLLEDSPDPKVLGIADSYRKIAADFTKKAVTLRDDYYKRSGQALAPNFGSIAGRVRDYVPRR